MRTLRKAKSGERAVAMKAICFNAECAKDTEEGLNLGKGAVSRRAMFFHHRVTEDTEKS